MAFPLLWLTLLLGVAAARRDRLKIAAFYHEDDGLHQDVALRHAVHRVNVDMRHMNMLELELRPVPAFDSFSIGKQTCELTAKGVAAVFGPQSVASTGIVRSICETLEIPHVVTSWDPGAPTSQYTNNLYPEPEVLSQALADMVRQMRWRSFTVLYESDDALIRLQGVLQGRNMGDNPITVRQLEAGKDYRPLLKEIKLSTETKIILDCAPENILDILRAAVNVKMMDVYCSYLLTSLDAHTLDYTEFLETGTNITTMRIVDPSSPVVQNAVRDWMDMEGHSGLSLTPETVKTETALMYDAVLLYVEAVALLNTSARIYQQRLDCSESSKWSSGLGISNFMHLKKVRGMTGDIELNNNGRRDTFSVDAVEYSRKGFRNIGTWDPLSRYVNTRSYEDLETQISDTMGLRPMIVTSRIGEPYLMERNVTDKSLLKGNDLFEGFSIDLIDEISQILKFKYEFKIVGDGEYGSMNAKTGEWNGLLGELLNRRADMAICDLTITYEREKAVDFTMPFMNLGISILYRKADKAATNLFSFLEPFSFDVWIYMATAYLGVSIVLFVLSRATPYEWDNPHPCNPDPDELENNFNMVNCLWFSMGSLMGQGCDILPKAVSTRMVAGMWWFFTLIMISSYTANLAAFLTVAKMDAEIKGVEDLAKQTKIKYGVYGTGSSARFFQMSNVSLYQRVWTVMQQTRPNVFTSGNVEGVERVKKGKGDYAFFMESTSIEYQMERDCELVKVGGELDSKGYGIAMPPDSPYRPRVNEAILKLQEAGRLKVLKKRWWKEKGGGACDDNEDEAAKENSNELGLSNVGGVFLVLFFGCTAAFLVSILEFLWNCRKIAVEEKITPWEAMVAEMKFAIHCSADTKPVSRKPPDETEGASFMELQLNYDKYDVEPK